MGTRIIQDEVNRTYIKRFFGGDKRGVCFAVDIKYREFTQKEFVEFLSTITREIIVSGEGKREA